MHQRFDSTGLAIQHNFLTPDQLRVFNQELDLLFSRPSVNGSLYGVFYRYRPGYASVSLPTLSIRSINLLELALRVRDTLHELLPAAREKSYRLTGLSIFSEENCPQPLFWHTDERKGMIRAQIYLQGGQADSGAFRYMVGTHQRDYEVEHKLSPRQIEELSSRIVECREPPGTLILFDSFGFHAKSSCRERRRTIMFEMQPAETDYAKASIYLASGDLTPKVVENIRFFINGHPKNVFVHGEDDVLRGIGAEVLPLRFAAIVFLSSLIWKIRFLAGKLVRSLQLPRK